MKQLFGLLGYPLGHSFSKNFFNEKFTTEGIDATYTNFEIPTIDELTEIVIKHPNLMGLNVTRPHKEVVIPFLDSLDSLAERVGAVNVIKFSRERGKLKLTGYNSDVVGFSNSLKPLLQPHHTKALVLGTGGASKAVCVGLELLGIAYKLVSRNPLEDGLTYDDLSEEVMQEYPVIINSTPLGTFPKVEQSPTLPYHLITPQHLCYDLIYNPDETLFLQRAKERGATTKNGLEMLILQAYESWRIWNE